MSNRGARTGPPPLKPGDVIHVDKGGGGNFKEKTVTRIEGTRIYFMLRQDMEAYVYARSFGRIWRLPVTVSVDSPEPKATSVSRPSDPVMMPSDRLRTYETADCGGDPLHILQAVPPCAEYFNPREPLSNLELARCLRLMFTALDQDHLKELLQYERIGVCRQWTKEVRSLGPD